MSAPRLSVIVTTFNRPALVQQAVESVLAQDAGPPFELIVIDDGSTDDTRDALRRFGTAVRYVPQPHAGLNPARNHALRLITGDLIAILDDDDVWLPFKTRALLPALAQYPRAGFVHSNFFVWRPDTGAQRPDGLHTWFVEPWAWDQLYVAGTTVDVPASPGAGPGPGRTVEAWYGDVYRWSLYGPMVLPSTAIVRRSAIAESRFAEDDHVGDWEFFARLSHRCGCAFVPVETTLNRSHEDRYRLTRADPRIRLLHRLGMTRRVWRTDDAFLRDHPGEVDRVEADCLRQLARAALRLGDRRTAREAMEAVRALPAQGRPSDAALQVAAVLPGATSAIAAFDWVRSRRAPRAS